DGRAAQHAVDAHDATGATSKGDVDDGAGPADGRGVDGGHAAICSRIHSATGAAPSGVVSEMNTVGSSPRCAAASRSITPRSALTRWAMSILLITRRSERVTPGPPLRGTLSPPA